MFCLNRDCKVFLEDKSNFCPSCGTKINKSEQKKGFLENFKNGFKEEFLKEENNRRQNKNLDIDADLNSLNSSKVKSESPPPMKPDIGTTTEEDVSVQERVADSPIQQVKNYKLAEKALSQAKHNLDTLIAETSDIALLYHIWKEVGASDAIRDKLKDLYPDKIPSDATAWFKIRPQKKGNATYHYLQIGWSRTAEKDQDGDPITEQGEVHLGSLSKFELTNAYAGREK